MPVMPEKKDRGMERNIEPLTHWLGTTSLPPDYSEYVSTISESQLVNSIVLIYSLDDIIERNKTFEVMEYCPGYLAIGDNSGGSAIVLCLKTGKIGIVDHGSMMPDDIHELADGFQEWQAEGFTTNYKA